MVREELWIVLLFYISVARQLVEGYSKNNDLNKSTECDEKISSIT